MRGARLLAAVALLAPLACSSKPSNNNYLGPTGGGGTSGTGGTAQNGKVTVTITAPADQASVNQNSSLTVAAMVDDDGTDFIDSTSVTATLTAGSSTTALAVGQLTSTGSDVYSGLISVGSLPTGTYTLTVSATSSGGAAGHSSVSIMISSGPTLTVNSPIEGKSYDGSVTIEIVVAQGAMPPMATLAGQALMPPPALATSANGTDVYRATVFFGPPGAAPSGVQTFNVVGPQLLDVTESDGSQTSEVKRLFVVDNTGPTITNTFPQPGDIVGGVVKVSATVSDDSGVLGSSVVAIIGDANGDPLFTLVLQPDLTGAYSALFDSRDLTAACDSNPSSLCIVLPTVSFRATDAVGNETSLGYAFALDNVAPLADLDPPPMRQLRLGPTGYECSYLFDPLSLNKFVGDMPNDLCLVPQVFDLRARIEDDGNHAVGLKITEISTVDPDNTNVYILNVPDTTNNPPLVVDTDGDGNCDAINPLLAPTTGPLTQNDQVLKIRLVGAMPGGSANFNSESDATLPNSECGKGTDLKPPPVLCDGDGFEQPTVAIGYSENLPAIWGVEPVDKARCLGGQFDTLANHVPENQWLCIAVATSDLAGNKSVSAPIRVYVQYQENGGFCATPPASAPPPPNCNGIFHPDSNTATTGTCATSKFTGTDYYCAPGGC
ncbi:MAG TPA: hypothetical protein VN853_22050 [Polyangia bacterium]|nr:hypothetical protein [Polyangia bacterium]